MLEYFRSKHQILGQVSYYLDFHQLAVLLDKLFPKHIAEHEDVAALIVIFNISPDPTAGRRAGRAGIPIRCRTHLTTRQSTLINRTGSDLAAPFLTATLQLEKSLSMQCSIIWDYGDLSTIRPQQVG